MGRSKVNLQLCGQILLLFSVLATSSVCLAAQRYVRAGATGNGSGSDWTNACPGFTGSCAPGSLVRGDTYYVADGSYGSITWNTPTSGTTTITIKKATTADHGTDTGWSSAFGDGQATFGDLAFTTSYWVFDGATRTESNWTAQTYGFRVAGSVFQRNLSPETAGNNVTIRYVDVGGTHTTAFNEGHPDYCFYFGGFSATITGWTVSKSYCHNVDLPFQLAGVDGFTIEENYIGPGWSKETIRGQIVSKNVTIRKNILRNACQHVPGDPPDGRVACTAQIAMWDGSPNGFDNIHVYGNVISVNTTTTHTNGCIFLGSNQPTAEPPANNARVFNNTFVGIANGTCSIFFEGGNTTNIARNNLWWNVVGTPGIVGGTGSHNGEQATDPFLNSALLNFHLLNAIAGTSTDSPAGNTTDIDSKTRGADGVWDRGAYEFGVGTPAPPSPPNALRIQ